MEGNSDVLNLVSMTFVYRFMMFAADERKGNLETNRLGIHLYIKQICDCQGYVATINFFRTPLHNLSDNATFWLRVIGSF